MRSRKDILQDLLHYTRSLSDLENELSNYPFDIPEPLIVASKEDFSNILKKSLSGEMTIDDLVSWANLIECRDDLSFEDDNLQEIIFDLANPEINGEITEERIKEIINELI